MISQHRIDELLFSEPNVVKIIRQVEQEATAELRAERDALRALLAEVQSWLANPQMTQWKYLEGADMYKDLLGYLGRIDAALGRGEGCS
jgi:hypothetical protein